MPFAIVRNDITRMQVDAIVNTANPHPVIGFGTDSQIHAKAGPQLLQARQGIGHIGVGQAAITPAFDLDAKYVIHTVGPVWSGGDHQEEALLRDCFDHALQLALANDCRSVAFPLICAGNYGFPKEKALRIAVTAFRDFLREHEMLIYLVVFDRDAFLLSRQRFQGVASYIDQNYVDARERATKEMRLHRRRMDADACVNTMLSEHAPCPPAAAFDAAPRPKPAILAELLGKVDAGFTETLLRLIDKSGKKDSEIYKKANLSKQHFSKIRGDPHYKPTKPTAIALAIALELDLEATKDLIGRAGYALTNSSKFDLIIRYFIEQGIYDIVEINMALYEFDQSLLGGKE